jgi:HEAT repeat protein
VVTNRLRAISIALTGLLAPGADAAGAQSQFQNGKVERRQTTAIDREISAIAASPEPVWVGWRVPTIAGDRGMCSWYTDRDGTIRGMILDHSATGTIVGGAAQRPQITPPAGPLPLEANTELVILLRLLDGRLERLRTVGDDCPIDAQGRTVHWLDGVTPAESLRYLEALTRLQAEGATSPLPRLQSGVASAALAAIANHRDAGADAILDRLAGAPENPLRQSAISHLGSLRGAPGFATLQRLLAAERMPEVRRQLTGALGQTREPGTVDAMRTLARDPDAKVRAEAVYWFAVRGGPAVVADVVRLIESDPDAGVKRRAISGISRLPGGAGIAPLLQLARTSPDPVVRKEAVSVLSRSTDPRATAFMEELIKK